MKKGCSKERMGNIIGNGNNNDASSSSTAGGAVQKKKRKKLSTSSSTPAGGTVQRKKKRRKLLNNVEQEKRGAPYRSQPAISTMIRILRAARQGVSVTGTDNSTSENRRMDSSFRFYRKLYSVEISKRPTCTCPDHLRRNNLLKHIIFTFVKVLGVSTANPVMSWKHC